MRITFQKDNDVLRMYAPLIDAMARKQKHVIYFRLFGYHIFINMNPKKRRLL
jgi:hypothetical protein